MHGLVLKRCLSTFSQSLFRNNVHELDKDRSIELPYRYAYGVTKTVTIRTILPALNVAIALSSRDSS